MRTWISCFVCVAAVAVSASAYALAVTRTVVFPGIDGNGNFLEELGAPIKLKGNVNTRRESIRMTGHGEVMNVSLRTQFYKNVPVSIPDMTISWMKYVVNRNGACGVAVVGQIQL